MTFDLHQLIRNNSIQEIIYCFSNKYDRKIIKYLKKGEIKELRRIDMSSFQLNDQLSKRPEHNWKIWKLTFL